MRAQHLCEGPCIGTDLSSIARVTAIKIGETSDSDGVMVTTRQQRRAPLVPLRREEPLDGAKPAVEEQRERDGRRAEGDADRREVISRGPLRHQVC